MRVLTAAAPLAANPAALYASCDADAIAALAVHKCLLKAQEADTLVSISRWLGGRAGSWAGAHAPASVVWLQHTGGSG